MFEQYPKCTARLIAVSLYIGLGALSAPAAAAPGIRAEPTGGSTAVSESGAVDYYTLRLTEKPLGDVTVTFNLAEGVRDGQTGQLLVFPRAVTFKAADYNPQRTITVTVSAVNDETPEGWQEAKISHNLSSTHPSDYEGMNVAGVEPVAVGITDDDLASVQVIQSGGSTSIAEGGEQDSYTIALSNRPLADVTITVQRVGLDGQPGPAEASSQVTVFPTSVIFTPTDWATPRTVTLTAIDDAKVDGTQAEELVHVVRSSDTAYTQYSIDRHAVTASIADNDVPGVLVSETAGATRVVEGGASDSYTLVLTSEPETYVSVTVLPGGEAEQVVAIPPRVTFTPFNYSIPQTITVSAVDDPFGEGRHAASITHSVSSGDIAYQGTPEDYQGTPEQCQGMLPEACVKGVTVRQVLTSIIDNDVPAVLVTESDGSSHVAEGSARDSYVLALTTRPMDEVAIEIRPGSQLAASPQRVVFTPENYDQAQTITLSAVDDRVVEESRQDTVTHEVTSSDVGYHRVPVEAVTVTVADNDSRGVLLSKSSLRVNEGGGGDSYRVSLSAQPAADVFVTILPDAQLSVSTTQLRFTPTDFAEPQEVEVTAIDDDVAQGPRFASIRHSIGGPDEGADEEYNKVKVGAISVAITDNDVPAVLVEESEGSTAVSESGGSDAYTLRLATRPMADVTVTITAGSQLHAEPATLTFTSADFDTPQAVKISAVDDADTEGTHLATVTHTVASGDGSYQNIAVSTVIVSIDDNDAVVELPVEEQPPVDEVQPQTGAQGSGGGGSLSWPTLAMLLGMAGFLAWLRPRWKRWG